MSPLLFRTLLILIPVVLYYEIISPLYSGGGTLYSPERSITELRDLSSQYDATLAQADSLAQQAEKLQSQYNHISDDTKQKLAVMIPENIDPVRLIDEIDFILKKAGFTSLDIGYTDTGSLDKGRTGYTISFSVKGNYTKFKDLLNTLEKSLRTFSVQAISFSSPDNPTDLTNFQVRMETYYMK
jgi:restriction endonuclease S subunit